MAEIPNLWPDDIRTDVLPPLVVLRAQAPLLARMTQGILDAEVTSRVASDGSFVRHQLDVVAPALDGYRHRILQVTHQPDRVYPATVQGEGLSSHIASGVRAYSQDELLKILGDILKSGEVKSTLISLIARSNEQKKAAATA